MKKILMVSALSSIFATGILASQESNKGMSSIQLGVTKAIYNGGNTGDSKIYFGTDLMVPLATDTSAFYFGVGFDLVAIDGVSSTSSTYGNYTLGAQAKVGYSLAPLIGWNVNLKADVGYGVTRWISSNYWGAQYSASIDTEVYNGWGIGYKYKHVNTGISGNIFDSYNTNIFFLEKTF